MEIKLTKVDVARIKHDYERLYESKEYHASEINKGINYTGYAESNALSYIKADAKIEAVHSFFFILGMNLWYDWVNKEAHITDRDGNEIVGK